MTKQNCRICKLEKTRKIGDFIHVIFQKEIKIKNVPYFECETCGDKSYEFVEKIDVLLKEAYRNNLEEIEFSI